MNDSDQHVINTLARVIPSFSDGQKEVLLAYAHGMAAMNNLDKSKQETGREEPQLTAVSK